MGRTGHFSSGRYKLSGSRIKEYTMTLNFFFFLSSLKKILHFGEFETSILNTMLFFGGPNCLI
jgi:hypothetical protein